MESVGILLTTYKRTEIAIKTVEKVKENLVGAEFQWFVADDGTHIENNRAVLEAILPDTTAYHINNRRGVGAGMNEGIKWFRSKEIDKFIILEDDWELRGRYEITEVLELLNDSEVGMVRFGYVSPGLAGKIVAKNNNLWWELDRNGYQYIYSGHPSIRHIRFHDTYGPFAEGIPPGQTELDMCAKYNAKNSVPYIYYPVYNQFGLFAHIGTDSLANVSPTNG